MTGLIPSNACLGEPVPAYCVTCGAWCAHSAPIITHRGVIATFRTCPECERRPAMTEHAHDRFVEGCFRCDLSNDEPLYEPDQTRLIGSQLEQPSPESRVILAELRRKRGLTDYDDRRPA